MLARYAGVSSSRFMTHDKVLILDFGAQYTQLIARRVRECHVYCEIVPSDTDLDKIAARRPIVASLPRSR